MKKLYLFVFSSFLFGGGDINLATVEELKDVKGIGEKLAERIIEYRKNHKVENLEDLKNVSGIGDKKLQALQKEFEIKNNQSEINKTNFDQNISVEQNKHNILTDMTHPKDKLLENNVTKKAVEVISEIKEKMIENLENNQTENK